MLLILWHINKIINGVVNIIKYKVATDAVRVMYDTLIKLHYQCCDAYVIL